MEGVWVAFVIVAGTIPVQAVHPVAIAILSSSINLSLRIYTFDGQREHPLCQIMYFAFGKCLEMFQNDSFYPAVAATKALHPCLFFCQDY